MKFMMKWLMMLALAVTWTSSGTSSVNAANVEGPKVFWKISVWGNPRALTAGMEYLGLERR